MSASRLSGEVNSWSTTGVPGPAAAGMPPATTVLTKSAIVKMAASVGRFMTRLPIRDKRRLHVVGGNVKTDRPRVPRPHLPQVAVPESAVPPLVMEDHGQVGTRPLSSV